MYVPEMNRADESITRRYWQIIEALHALILHVASTRFVQRRNGTRGRSSLTHRLVTVRHLYCGRGIDSDDRTYSEAPMRGESRRSVAWAIMPPPVFVDDHGFGEIVGVDVGEMNGDRFVPFLIYLFIYLFWDARTTHYEGTPEHLDRE